MKKILVPIIALTILIFVAGCNFFGGSTTGSPDGEQQNIINGNNETKAPDSEGSPIQDSTMNVMVYFGEFQTEKVVPETRTVEVKKEDSIEKVIFDELMKGPASEELDPVIPEGTELLSVKSENGICTLNLSKEFVENHIGGSAAELMTINAIVASFTELPDITKVQFLIEGNVREFFFHEALDSPIERNESVIKK